MIKFVYGFSISAVVLTALYFIVPHVHGALCEFGNYMTNHPKLILLGAAFLVCCFVGAVCATPPGRGVDYPGGD